MIHVFFFLSLLFTWVISTSQSFLVCSQPPTIQLCSVSHAQPTGDDDCTTPQEVSDAEALLACYAFLKRRKRLDGNWTQKERRQRMKAVAQPHYFWEEDLSKIATRLQKDLKGDTTTSANRRMVLSGEDEDDWLLLYEGDSGETRMRPSRTSSAAEVWSGEFTSFPTDPSPTRMRRSMAAKETWADPDFRYRWYQRRWLNKVKNKDPEILDDMALEQQIKALPTGFLGSPELCSMTEEEISMAIQTYLTKTKKQNQSRKETLNARKEVLQRQMENVLLGSTSRGSAPDESLRISRDSLFSPNPTTLQDAQRKRSELAKQIYQKRLEKLDQPKPLSKQAQHSSSLPTTTTATTTTTTTTTTTKHCPQGKTPQDAMVRILYNLERGILPSVDDVEIIMKPGKMSKRRVVLRRILSDHFNLRGKSVPSLDANGDLGFVTTCSIDDLGALVIDLIRKEKRKQQSRDDKTIRNDDS